TQRRPSKVGLVGIKQELAKLGCLAKTDRQNTGGKWIQATGMAGLSSPEQVPNSLQGLVGREPQRLIEQQNAVDLTEPFFTAGQTHSSTGRLPASSRSRARSIKVEIRRPCTNVRS